MTKSASGCDYIRLKITLNSFSAAFWIYTMFCEMNSLKFFWNESCFKVTLIQFCLTLFRPTIHYITNLVTNKHIFNLRSSKSYLQQVTYLFFKACGHNLDSNYLNYFNLPLKGLTRWCTLFMTPVKCSAINNTNMSSLITHKVRQESNTFWTRSFIQLFGVKVFCLYT